MLRVLKLCLVLFSVEQLSAQLDGAAAQLEAKQLSQDENSFVDVVWKVNQGLFSYLSKKNTNENIIISPLSVGVALSMLYHGSRGSTQQQLKEAFNLPHTDALKGEVSILLDKYLDPKSAVTFRMGNGIFLNEGFKPKQDYMSLLEEEYDAELRVLNSETNKVDDVNDWVRNKTSGIIKTFLSEGSITDQTQMLLLNAIYFYGAWEQPFEDDLTSLQRFYTDGTKQKYILTEFMELQAPLEIVNDPGRMQVVKLPYTDTNYSMLVLLPSPDINIDQLAEEIFDSSAFIDDLLNRTVQSEVNLYMPKFDISTKNSLVEALEYLNVTDLFDFRKADLSPISDQPIEVGDILHSASIKVDEEGSEAAAITSVSIDIRTAVKGTLIRVDRPFLFSIVDSQGVVLFTGKIMTPSDRPTELNTDLEAPEDTLLAVHRAEGEEQERPDTVFDDDTDENAPAVNIKCPKGVTHVSLAEFTNCEETCLDGPSYGLCIFGCWSRFCL